MPQMCIFDKRKGTAKRSNKKILVAAKVKQKLKKIEFFVYKSFAPISPLPPEIDPRESETNCYPL